MLRRRHRDEDDDPESPATRRNAATDAEQLVEEAQAFLDGRLLDVLRRRGGPVEGWVWLNQLAHGDAGDVLALALAPPGGTDGDGWRAARAAVALELLNQSGGSLDHLRSLQDEALVPLELDLATGAITRLSPAGLLALARAELHGLTEAEGDGA